MAITLVQHKKNSAVSGSTASVTGMSATTSGNLLVAIVSAYKNPGQVTFTPPVGWTQAGTTTHDDLFISISTAVFYYENNPGGATSFSFTLSTSVSAWHIDVMEFNGVATASPYDGYASREQHSTTPSSGAITTTAAGDLLIGWTEEDDNNGTYTFTYPAGWTQFSTFPITDTNAWGHSFAAWKIGGSAGSENWAPTMSSSGPDGIYTLVAFKAASGGGASVQGQASLSAGVTLSASGVLSVIGSSNLSGSLNLSAAGALSLVGAAAFSGTLNLSAAATMTLAATAILSASLDLTADSAVLAGGGIQGAAALAASAALQAAGVVTYAAQATLSAELGLDAQASLALVGAAVLAASLTLSATGQHSGSGIFENVTASLVLLALLSATLDTPTFPLTADIALLNVGPEGTVQ